MKILIDEGATVDFFTDDNVDENSKALGVPYNGTSESGHREQPRQLPEVSGELTDSFTVESLTQGIKNTSTA